MTVLKMFFRDDGNVYYVNQQVGMELLFCIGFSQRTHAEGIIMTRDRHRAGQPIHGERARHPLGNRDRD